MYCNPFVTPALPERFGWGYISCEEKNRERVKEKKLKWDRKKTSVMKELNGKHQE